MLTTGRVILRILGAFLNAWLISCISSTNSAQLLVKLFKLGLISPAQMAGFSIQAAFSTYTHIRSLDVWPRFLPEDNFWPNDSAPLCADGAAGQFYIQPVASCLTVPVCFFNKAGAASSPKPHSESGWQRPSGCRSPPTLVLPLLGLLHSHLG